MGIWWEFYQKKQDTLRLQWNQPNAASVPQDIIEAATLVMEDTLAEYLRKERTLALREAAGAAVSGGRELLGLLRGTAPRFSQTQAQAQTKPARKKALFGLDPTLPPLALSIILLVYLFLNGQLWPALLCAGSVILWLLTQLRETAPNASNISIQANLSTPALLRSIDGFMLETDRSLERAALLAQREAGSRLPEMDGEILEAVQMLSEAYHTQDGAYALKALPGLFAGLLQKQVRLQPYTSENAAAFDLFPGARGGITIRPAVYLSEKLILRGQATQEV